MADNAPSARPLSPHLQIWRFTVTMAASITHRGTGAVLYGGTILLAYWLAALALHGEGFGPAAAFANSLLGRVVIAGYVWSLSFHLMNGLRHLYWDAGRGLAPKTAAMTAWLVYAAAIVLTAVILWAGLAGGGA